MNRFQEANHTQWGVILAFVLVLVIAGGVTLYGARTSGKAISDAQETPFEDAVLTDSPSVNEAALPANIALVTNAESGEMGVAGVRSKEIDGVATGKPETFFTDSLVASAGAAKSVAAVAPAGLSVIAGKKKPNGHSTDEIGIPQQCGAGEVLTANAGEVICVKPSSGMVGGGTGGTGNIPQKPVCAFASLSSIKPECASGMVPQGNFRILNTIGRLQSINSICCPADCVVTPGTGLITQYKMTDPGSITADGLGLTVDCAKFAEYQLPGGVIPQNEGNAVQPNDPYRQVCCKGTAPSTGSGVGTTDIIDGSRLVTGSVNGAKIASGTLTSTHVQDGTLTTTDIKDGTILQADLGFTIPSGGGTTPSCTSAGSCAQVCAGNSCVNGDQLQKLIALLSAGGGSTRSCKPIEGQIIVAPSSMTITGSCSQGQGGCSGTSCSCSISSSGRTDFFPFRGQVCVSSVCTTTTNQFVSICPAGAACGIICPGGTRPEASISSTGGLLKCVHPLGANEAPTQVITCFP